jgi:hypothetical protein
VGPTVLNLEHLVASRGRNHHVVFSRAHIHGAVLVEGQEREGGGAGEEDGDTDVRGEQRLDLHRQGRHKVAAVQIECQDAIGVDGIGCGGDVVVEGHSGVRRVGELFIAETESFSRGAGVAGSEDGARRVSGGL